MTTCFNHRYRLAITRAGTPKYQIIVKRAGMRYRLC